MKKFIYAICAMFVVFASADLKAQDGLKLKIGYNTGMPVGSFKDFMGKNSYRGFHGDITYAINDKFDIGLGIASQDYYEKFPRQLYETKDGVVSAVLTNSIQTTPILVKANYNLTTTGLISPYVGLGAGFNFIRYGQYLGEFGDATSAFKPAASADAGVNIFFNKEARRAGVNVGANFNYMPYNKNGLDGLNNWGLHAGVFFPLR